MKITVTCGYNSSLHTLALLRLLEKESIRVDNCLIVSTYSLKRVRAYYRQLDKAEFIKKLKDRIIGNRIINTGVSEEMKYILQLKEELKIHEKQVTSYCRNCKIPYKVVKDLNSDECIDFLKESDLGIYSGGGILRKKFLSRFRLGVLNCHGAKLPEIRGMNSAEWSILLDVPLRNTLHFMVRKLDMGPILMLKAHDYSNIQTIDQLRGISINYAVYDLVEGVKNILANTYTTTQQRAEDGKQFFTMHPRLKVIVNKKLSKNAQKDL